MKNHPQIKFLVSPQADIKNSLNFLCESNDLLKIFLPIELHFFLRTTFNKSEQKKIITAYTKNIYSLYKNNFQTQLKKIEKKWLKLAPLFYKLTDQIFPNHPWPKGKYYGFATIFRMFPRYLSSRTFFLSTSNPKLALRTISHEMIHFIFFDYLYQKYHLQEKSILKNQPKNQIWVFSEAFNNMLENWPPYFKFFYTKGSKYFDPQVNLLARKLAKNWNKKQDIDELINTFLLQK